MNRRTRTYIAADWDGDKEAVNKLYQWNNSAHWGFNFIDAHELTQARDDSLPCSIKKSLKERLNASKTLVLIVGHKTDVLTKGGCQHCLSYISSTGICPRSPCVDYRSFVKYECETALKSGMKLVVLYNYAYVYRNKCPQVLRHEGTHLAMFEWINENGQISKHWKYQEIKSAIED